MMIGRNSVQISEIKECQIFCIVVFCWRGKLRRLVCYYQVSISVAFIIMLGVMFVINSLLMDNSLETSKIINGMEGGIIGAIMSLEVISFVVRLIGQLALRIIGISRAVTAAVFVTVELERFVIIIVVSTSTQFSSFGLCFISFIGRLIMRFDKSFVFMILFVSIKNGIVSREKLSVSFISVCVMIWILNMFSQNINVVSYNNSVQVIGKSIVILFNRQFRKISIVMIKFFAVATLENCYA